MHCSAAQQVLQHAVGMHTCRRDTLASMFLNSLRRGGALEAALAARCLGLEAVTLGAGEECEQCVLDP